MAQKRPLEAAPPEQEAPRSPRKRLRRTVLLMMWLERRRARAVTVGQMEHMVSQAQLDRAKLFVFLMLLVSRLCSVERLLQQLRNLLPGAFRSLTVSIQDPIRSTVQTEMQGRQAASLPNRISEPPRHIPEGFPETGGNTRVKLRFVDVDRPEDPIYTGYPVQWLNKKDARVAVFENDRQITQGDLSKLQIEILAVHAEFFTERGQADFTKEEFNKQICIHKGNESVLTTVNLANGAAYIGSVIFTESSQRKRLRLTARVKGQDLDVRVQEAITDPFVVKVGRSKQNRKSYPPSKEEAVYRLEKISLKGKHCTLLSEKNITTVKQFLRHYYRDESGLQKIIVNKWKMSAYEKFDERENSGGLTPDYFMTNGGPVSAGPSVQAGRMTWQYPNGKAAQHVLSNNDAGPSNQETLPFPQHTYAQTVHQGLGEHNPSVPQNGAPYSLHQGTILNDQGQFSAQSTIPPNNFSSVPQDDMITGASLTGQGTSSLDPVLADISSGFSSVPFEDYSSLDGTDYLTDYGIALANNAELPNPNRPFDGHGHDGGNQ
ncbi:unnamed protein product [Triticum turgidum subsp. durum]|uniref:Calmodulin-binding protein n=1 Tax=Triticum turgidum subsp. durum TaxID=4567 RepID=A0A9R0XIH2_TRITD|nr:unnamed protein product [Triticum turgidum subsp. durum]